MAARELASARTSSSRKVLQHWDIQHRRARQTLLGRCLGERGRKRAKRGELERSVAPLQHFYGIEGVALQRLRQIVLERRAAAGRTEGSVTHCAAGAARDLAKLRRVKFAELISVEFAVGRKGDVIDIEIEPHADRIGRDQIIAIARMIDRDLRVAGARRKRPITRGAPRWRRISSAIAKLRQ